MMHRIISILFFHLTFLISINAQQLTLPDVINPGAFRPNSPVSLQSSKDGQSYTVLENNTSIVRYNYKTGQREVVLDVRTLKKDSLRSIEDYAFSSNESKILLMTDRTPLYRRSFKAAWYVCNLATKELSRLSAGQQQVATFSPDGERIAFVRDHNLFIKSLRFGTERQVTSDGFPNKILNGIPDWVYEEEFEFIRAYEWSPDSRQLAFIKFNEEKVPDYSMLLYPKNSLYPAEITFKYPKAGEKNSVPGVYVYDIKSGQTLVMDTGSETDIYIPQIQWSYSGKNLGIFRMNRLQNRLELLFANPNTGDTRLIYTEKNKRYIETDFLDNFQFLPDDKSFVVLSEQNGWKQLYLYDETGIKIRQVTTGNFDVMKFYGYDPVTRMFYYQAAAVSPLQREVYGMSMDGKKLIALSDKKGTNSAEFSANFQYFVNNYTNLHTPNTYSVWDIKGKPLRIIEDNHLLKEKTNSLKVLPKEFFSFKTPEGVLLNGYMIKPREFSQNNKFAVLMTQYSGPNSQEVLDLFGVNWENYLAEKGYLVVCVDPRGSGARGEEFRKCTYGQLGKLESDDQIAAAKYLASLSYVDAKKIAIWGWSYGGFVSTLCMARGGDVFRAGIAVSPVTSFRFYDTVYSERYNGLPGQNPEGYDDPSPLKLAGKIKNKFLLVHGSADDNVHLQNTMELSEAMVQAGIPFREMIYPNRNHNLTGGNTRLHLYSLFEEFLKESLK